jgi:vacuolar-type H+-ATPase subunit E/Vma4
MPIDELIKVLNEDIQNEIENILKNAQAEKDKIISEAKKQIDEEFENEKEKISGEFEKTLSLQKLSIESENRRKVNEKFTETFNEIYNETITQIKNMLISLKDKENFILAILGKIVDNLPDSLNKSNIEVILSKSDYESLYKKVESLLKTKGIEGKITYSEIEGGIIVKVGKLSIDNSLDRIISMFKPVIINLIYKHLPKSGY